MEKRKKNYFHIFKKLTTSEIADIVTCALETLPVKDQLEIFRKFFNNMDDPKKKRMFQNKINEFIEKKTKWRKADWWMETHMKNNPDKKPKAVADEYMVTAKIDRLKKNLYRKLARTVYDRLRKRKERGCVIGDSKAGSANKR